MNNLHYGSERYYADVFELLDKSGKHTWNWAAFFFGPCWMAYRKMYLYSLLGLLLAYPAIGIFATFISGLSCLLFPVCFATGAFAFGTGMWMLFCMPLIVHCLYGYFGNALYYRIVRQRIFEGYHLIDQYKPTSITAGLSCGVFGFIICISDIIIRNIHFSKKEQQENSDRKISNQHEISQQNIIAYLNENRHKHWVSWIADIIVCICLLSPTIIVPTIVSHYSEQKINRFMNFDDFYDDFNFGNEAFDFYIRKFSRNHHIHFKD